MKKIFGIILLFLTITSGLSAWSWTNYRTMVNMYMKDPSEENEASLMGMYKLLISDTEEKYIGPGIFADYGYFLAIEGNKDEALKMFQKEIEGFPESEIFVGKLIEEVTGEPYTMKNAIEENKVHPGLEFLPVQELTPETESAESLEQESVEDQTVSEGVENEN